MIDVGEAAAAAWVMRKKFGERSREYADALMVLDEAKARATGRSRLVGQMLRRRREEAPGT